MGFALPRRNLTVCVKDEVPNGTKSTLRSGATQFNAAHQVLTWQNRVISPGCLLPFHQSVRGVGNSNGFGCPRGLSTL